MAEITARFTALRRVSMVGSQHLQVRLKSIGQSRWARSATNRSLARWSASLSWLPSSSVANPHWVDSASRSRGWWAAACSTRAATSSGSSRRASLLETTVIQRRAYLVAYLVASHRGLTARLAGGGTGHV